MKDYVAYSERTVNNSDKLKKENKERKANDKKKAEEAGDDGDNEIEGRRKK